MAVSTYPMSEIIAALSHALDLTQGQPLGHAQRSCILGMGLAERLELGAQARRDLFYAVLLKDAGCSTTAARLAEVFDTDERAFKHDLTLVEWSDTADFASFAADQAGPGASSAVRAERVTRALALMAGEFGDLVDARCHRGAEIVTLLGFPDPVARAVRSLTERWDGSGGPDGLAGEEIPLLARIASLAQTAEVYLATHGRQAAREVVRRRRGAWFDPQIADAFLAVGPHDPLWERLDGERLTQVLVGLEPAALVAVADERGLDRVAEAFAGVVDAKSPFTARHSSGVAAYAVAIGEQLGTSGGELRWLRRAALLHDIGKLGVSSRILDKPGRLTDAELAEVRRHPRHTYEILSQISAFAGIAEDAAAHHERLDGRGYHRGLAGGELSPAARILAVADVYEALTAERPYRAALAREQVLATMRAESGGAFDPDCLDALAAASELVDGRRRPQRRTRAGRRPGTAADAALRRPAA